MENKIIEKKKNGRPKKITEKKFKIAVQDSQGIKAVIAKRLGCTWVCVNNYVKSNPFAQKLLDEESEVVLDMAESVVFNAIKNGDERVAEWYLQKKGKNRGYCDNVGIQVKGNENAVNDNTIIIDVDTRNLIDRIKMDAMGNPPVPRKIKKLAPAEYNEE